MTPWGKTAYLSSPRRQQAASAISDRSAYISRPRPCPPLSFSVSLSPPTLCVLCPAKTLAEILKDTRLQSPSGQADGTFCSQRWRERDRERESGVFLFFFSFFLCKFPPSGMVLNYSNSVDCAALICQEPKSTSLFPCVKTDEAGEEDGKLRQRRWHCEYLMACEGAATDPKSRTSSQPNYHPGCRGFVWLKFKIGKHFRMAALYHLNGRKSPI